jgi:hypothetical protein
MVAAALPFRSTKLLAVRVRPGGGLWRGRGVGRLSRGGDAGKRRNRQQRQESSANRGTPFIHFMSPGPHGEAGGLLMVLTRLSGKSSEAMEAVSQWENHAGIE